MQGHLKDTSDPNTANHHWYPFLRYAKKCVSEGKEVILNDWLISNGKVKSYEHALKVKAEAKAKAEAEAEAEEKAKAKAEAEEKAKAKAETEAQD